MPESAEKVWAKLTLTDDDAEFQDYQSTWLLRLSKRINELILFLLIKVPTLYRAFVLNDETKWLLRDTVRFFLGLLLGITFYYAILVDLQLEPNATKTLGVSICLFAAIGNVVSTQARCISLLLPIRFGNKTGRSVLLALVIVYVSSGPITNILTNLRECIRVIVCQMVMTFSLLKTKYEILFKPLLTSFERVRGSENEGQELVAVVNDVLVPLERELEDEQETQQLKEQNDYIDSNWNESSRSKDTERRHKILFADADAEQIQKKYATKLEYRCQSVMTKLFDQCGKIFEPLRSKCADNLPGIIHFMCDFFTPTYLCNAYQLAGGDSDQVCTSKGAVDPDTGESYQQIKDSIAELRRQFLNTRLRVKLVDVPPEAKETAQSMYEASRKIVQEFKDQKSGLDIIILIIMRMTAFSFIFVILNCNSYISNYLNDIEADNRYITLYFRRIDYRRHVKGKLTLLPLKRDEKKLLSDVYEFRLTEDDVGELNHALTTTIILLLFSILLILVDVGLYTVLIDLRTYGRIEYAQVGSHDIQFQIKGLGFLASFLRSIVNSFAVKQRIKRIITNEECLPNPSVPGQYTFKIFGTFILLFVMAVLNAWVLNRANHYVCSIFFPKAEKKRILYLYNEHLKKRITFLNYRLDIVRRETVTKTSDDLTFYRVLNISQPKWFGWLQIFKENRRKCLICGEYEPKKSDFYPCNLLFCYAYYDVQCWNFVVKHKCIGCPRYADPVPPSEEEI